MKQGFRWCTYCGKPHPLADRACAVTGLYFESNLHHLTRASFLAPGTVIDGKYRILEPIGIGGMGAVFDAISLRLDRRVALKVVMAGRGGRQATDRMFREARILSKLRHPNVCNVYDAGTLDNGSPYLVLERLYGTTLGARIARSGPLPVAEALEVFQQILSGLHAAHSQQILHRDLKPHNIFLSGRMGSAPLASIVDFGLALDLADVRLTRPGRTCGTPHYMSPEQIQGEIVDERSDVFSAAVSLFEALTGVHPFLGSDSDDTRQRILRRAPRSLRRYRKDVPASVEAAIAWALEKDRARRAVNALAFQEALRAASTRTLQLLVDGDEDTTNTRPIWRPSELSPMT